MPNRDGHPTDDELLLAADGELASQRAREARAHLNGCGECRARVAEAEETFAELGRIYQRCVDPLIPPIARPRARLRVRLAELTAMARFDRWNRSAPVAAFAACLCLFVLVVANGNVILQRFASHGNPESALSAEFKLIPDSRLTPGATRTVKIGDVCAMPHEDVVRDVSPALRKEIFQEYGIASAHPGDYEIDYLIAPGLGGAEDVHNLWPEPYMSSAWNAHVKDALEEQLHEMVCTGKLDLPTAQHDIATDWIAAYKKYFHTDTPLPLRSGNQRIALDSKV